MSRIAENEISAREGSAERIETEYIEERDENRMKKRNEWVIRRG